MTGRDDTRDVIARALAEYVGIKRAPMWDGADVVLAALAAAGKSIVDDPAKLTDDFDAEGNYLGKKGTTHEHRTVGSYRAWSYDAHEWCYPSDPCHLCKEVADA